MTLERVRPTQELEALGETIRTARETIADAQTDARQVLGNILEGLSIPERGTSVFVITTEDFVEAAKTASEKLGDEAQEWIPENMGGKLTISTPEGKENIVISFRAGRDSELPISRFDNFEGFSLIVHLDSKKIPFLSSIIESNSRMLVSNPQTRTDLAWGAFDFTREFTKADQLTQVHFLAELLSRTTPVAPMVPQTAPTS